MSKRRYRFGFDYFADWTLDRIYAAGYEIHMTPLRTQLTKEQNENTNL